MNLNEHAQLLFLFHSNEKINNGNMDTFLIYLTFHYFSPIVHQKTNLCLFKPWINCST